MPTLDEKHNRHRVEPSKIETSKAENPLSLRSGSLNKGDIDLDRTRRSVIEAQEDYDNAAVHNKVREKNTQVQTQKNESSVESKGVGVQGKTTQQITKEQQSRNAELVARNTGRNLGSEKEALKAIDKELNKYNLTADERKKMKDRALAAFHETYQGTKADLPWYKRVGNCIAHPIRTSQKLAEVASKVYHQPFVQHAVDTVKEKITAGASFALHHPVQAFFAAQKAVADLTWKVVKAVPGFVKSMSDSIGLTQCLNGVWSGIKGTGQLALGIMTLNKDMVNAGLSNLKQSRDAIVGAVRVAAELTGIADLYYMGKYALQGNWGMVAMHAGFALMSVGSIAATVATGGAACGAIVAVAAGRSSLKTAAKTALKVGAENFIKSMSKDFTKNCLKDIGQKVSTELCKTAAHEAAESAAKVVLEATTKNGAEAAIKAICGKGAKSELQLLGKEIAEVGQEAALKRCRERLTEVACEKYGHEAVSKVLKEAGAEETIAEWTKKTLGLVKDKKSFMNYATTEMGLSKEEAKKTFSQAKKAILSGKSDQEIAELYGKDLKAGLEEMLLREKGMSKEFEKTFKETLEKSGKLEKEEVENLTKKGVQSFEKGAKQAIDETVESGIKRGLRALRHIRAVRGAGTSSKTESELKEGGIVEASVEKDAKKTFEGKEGKVTDGGRKVINRTTVSEHTITDETETYVDGQLVDRVRTVHTINKQIAEETKQQVEEVAKKGKNPTNAA